MKRLAVAAAFVVAFLANAGAGPYNIQPPYQTITAGFIDPTAATFNGAHPMVACASSCGSPLVNQNTDALQAAITLASGTTHPWIFLPPGEYPIFRGGVAHNQAYGVLMSGVDRVVIRGYGATLRGTGNLGGAKFVMVQVQNTSTRIRFHGLTFSQRDYSGTQEEHAHMISLGDANTADDDIQIVDCAFVEGKGGAGDAVQLNGGGTQLKLLTRVTVTRSQINSYGRDGLSFQHGTADMNFYRNRFGPDQNPRCSLGIHHEPTSAGKNVDENIVENVFDCAVASSLSWSGWTTETTERVVFARNNCQNCGIVARNTVALWYVDNVLTSVDAGSAIANLQGGTTDDTWVTGNLIKQQTADISSPAVFHSATVDGAVKGVWVDDNEIEQFDCISTGNSSVVSQHARFWLTDNQLTYRSVTALKCTCLAASSTASNSVATGWITGNSCRNGKLADNSTTAGKWDVAALFAIGSYAHVGHGWVRDNLLDGGKRTLFLSYSAAQLDEGVPVVSGNRGIANTSGENEPALLRTETTTDAETLSTSAALSPVKRWSYLPSSSCGTDSHALADGKVDGIHKYVKVSTTCTVDVTITPTHFGDGTSFHCLTGPGAPNCYADLVWDAAGAKWRLIETDNFLVTP